MATISTLTVALELESKGYHKGLAAAAKAADKFKKQVESQTRAAESSTGRMQRAVSSNAGKLQTALGKVGTSLDNLTGNRLMPAIGAIQDRLGPAFTRAGAFAKKAGAAIATALATAASAVATAAAGIGVAIGAIVGGFALLTRKAFQLGEAAAHIGGIRAGFKALAADVQGGASAMLKALQDASSGMVDSTSLMQKWNLAAQLVSTQFAEKLPDALGLIQKVAASTGQDMNFLLNSLITGVGRLSPLLLDNLAISVDTAAAYETWAKAQDRSVQSMSKAEKQAALMNQVLDRLRENTAKLPGVAGSAAEAFAQWRAGIQNVKDDLGVDLSIVMAQVARQLTQWLPLIKSVGQGFVGSFAGIMDAASAFARGFMQAMGTDMNNVAGAAQGWGANISISLAQGLAAGASAIIDVLNAIGNAIANWLAPGSPPKLLPDIDDWGTAAINEWIQGMAAGDVGILRSLSGKVESFLRSLGGGSGAEIAKTILRVRENIESALAGSGDLFKGLPAAVHGYAEALLATEAATEKVARAQDELNSVTEEYAKRLSPIDKELSAIEARRQAVIDQQRRTELQAIVSDEGAPALAKEMAQLELREMQLRKQKSAVEDERDVAVGAAEDKLSAAEAEQQAAEERLRLEEQLLQHQTETNNLLKETVENIKGVTAAALSAAGGGGAGGAADALADKFDDLGAGVGGANNAIGESLSELTQRVREEFAPIQEKAEQLGRTWARVANLVDLSNLDIGQAIQGTIDYHKRLAFSVAENALKIIGWVTDTGDTISSVYGPDGIVVQGLNATSEFISGKLSTAFETVFGSEGVIVTTLNTASEAISTKIQGMADKMNELRLGAMDALRRGFNRVKTAISGVVTWLGNLITKINNFPSLPGALAAMIHQSPPPLALGMKEVRAEMRALTTSELPMLQRQMGALQFAGAGALRPDATAERRPLPAGPLVQFGDVHIYDEMDARSFEARVNRTVKRALFDHQ